MISNYFLQFIVYQHFMITKLYFNPVFIHKISVYNITFIFILSDYNITFVLTGYTITYMRKKSLQIQQLNGQCKLFQS